MITRVRLHYFKLFRDEQFDLSDHVVLAGPNNSGKTTLLQAIAAWHLALQRWTAERGATSKAKKRTGVPVTRKDFTAIPLREMKLLWTDTSFSLKKDEGKAGSPRAIRVTLEGTDGDQGWDLTFEFRYQSSEQIYVKPSEKDIEDLPRAVKQFSVVHVPPFSGIGAEEPLYDRPYQDLLIGQGKAGDIVRNLLLEVHRGSSDGWQSLCQHIREIFGYTLMPPQYEGRPFIVCDYLPGVPEGKGKGGLPRLDIASAGSGFHQVLLLLGFLYARPSTVYLLDEPDAHEHVVLQKQIYDSLRRIAIDRPCQLLIATHAEVLIDNTSPDLILSFYGKPHRLVGDPDRDQVREALKRLSATDILLAEQSNGVLYVESQKDFDLLHAWAKVLVHPMRKWFAEGPFWHSNQGRNPREAKGHFFALSSLGRSVRGILLLDGDNRGLPDHEVAADGLVVERWNRYEAENYLIHPQALTRFVESKGDPISASLADKYLRGKLPPEVYSSPLQRSEYLESVQASKTLLPGLFKAVGLTLKRDEYFLIAEQMQPSEVPDEVSAKLDAIARAFTVST